MSEEGKKDDIPEEKTNVLSFEEEKEKLRREMEMGFRDVENSTLETDNENILKEMNSKHAFINSYGGRPMVLCHVYSNVEKKDIIEFRTPDAISIQYSNQSVKVDKQFVEVGRWWIRHSARREYNSVFFDPAHPREYNKCFNLYEGLNCTPQSGVWKETLRHIYKILCNKNRDKFKYVIKWFAWTLQNPGKQAEIVLIFKGKEGAGKGFIFSQFCSIFGNHGLHISNRKHLTGDFNGHLATCVFLFADEAYYPGDKEVEGALNQLISEEKIAVEKKRMDVIVTKNCLHIGMATNSEWVIPAGGEARRYFINTVDNSYAKNQTTDRKREAYFNKLWGEMNNGGREAMVHDLLNIDLTDWHPRFNVPVTEELKNQASISLSGVNKAMANLLDRGEFPGAPNREYTEFRANLTVLDEYINKYVLYNYNKLSARAKTAIYKKIGGKREHSREGNFWVFPALKECKENFLKNIQNNYIFETMEDEWTTGKTDF